MFVQSQQALPVPQVQEWVLLWTLGSQVVATRLCRGSPLLFPGAGTALCDSQTLAPPASHSLAASLLQLGEGCLETLVSFPFSGPFFGSLIRSFPREHARLPEGMCSAGVGVICLGSYLLEGVV